jgi:altronate dehydratase small subunit
MKNYVYMTDKDNVVTMIRQLNAGEAIEVDGVKIKANQDIPVYHKIAIEEIKTGETVVKYSESIGTASCDIHIGDWVHTQNLESGRGRGDR